MLPLDSRMFKRFIEKKTDTFRLCPILPLMGAYHLHHPDARATVSDIGLLCKDTWSLTGGGCKTYWDKTGKNPRKELNLTKI